ncbi:MULTISPECIES: type II secretion system protein GspD [unclassified Campylobacter]|uniref:type II secretion system protein GspD n=1 Tax=unclassified Campylobacter TaxID=2593542 RepID=UPI0022E9C6ED|nr:MULTISPECIES: type II and III secretion system protein [unclassified Campylobacter]MDA3048913.1 type II and III secretion system protein [Campylobacter sp. JMF_15 NE4]MDA3054311.1 type II and III secretion system protein [Campylobacter sp. VBCF_07 NA4]MDA3061003.1 type II and III secretion system protein [Campylobacter sp. VBCF_02 NA5]MDA3070517.1 type II and III secretion system protein [Campylobacter sp. VBCF_08 NA3]WBR53820.1 type II and III secretion system protein [Campylobacter sp. VB
MKKILILILVFWVQILNADSFKHSLVEFVSFASSHNNVNIIVSEKANEGEFYFFSDEKEPKISLDMLREMLLIQGLTLIKFDSFFLVDFLENNIKNLKTIEFYNEENKEFDFYSVSLNNFVKDDIKQVLQILDINSTYIDNSNTLFYIADDEKQSKILSALQKIDDTPKQTSIKLTILETNLKDLKDRGSEITSYLKSFPSDTFNYFLNLITMPYNAVSNVTANSKSGYYGVLRFLDLKDFSDIKSSPFFTIRSGKELYFSSVENIPYLMQNKEFTDSRQSVTSSYEYRDIGLKITLYPIILKDGSVDLSLHLIVEDIISNENDKPMTSKKELKSSYIIKKGELLVLSGINKQITYDKKYSIPLLSDIWFIGNLFSFSSKENKDTTLTLSIEIL